MEKLRMGIVGAGIWGETHASIYNEHPFAKTVAICDQNRSKAEALAAKFGIEEIYTDYREMAEKLFVSPHRQTSLQLTNM